MKSSYSAGEITDETSVSLGSEVKVCQFLALRYSKDFEESPVLSIEEAAIVVIFAVFSGDLSSESELKLADITKVLT